MKWAGTTVVFCRSRFAPSLGEPESADPVLLTVVDEVREEGG